MTAVPVVNSIRLANGPTTGLSATYFNKNFSADLLLKFDLLSLNEQTSDLLAFSSGCLCVAAQGPTTPLFQSSSFSLTNTNVAGNSNYRFDLQPNLWLEPTVGAHYTNSSCGGGASALGLQDACLAPAARRAYVIRGKMLMSVMSVGMSGWRPAIKGHFRRCVDRGEVQSHFRPVVSRVSAFETDGADC